MQLINREDLVPEKEYYIECLSVVDGSSNAIVNESISKMIGTFQFNKNGFAFFKFFRQVNEPIEFGYDVQLGTFWQFYLVRKTEIQNKMESRAVEQILRNVVKDEYFVYMYNQSTL
jgi:hypothetical protein